MSTHEIVEENVLNKSKRYYNNSKLVAVENRNDYLSNNLKQILITTFLPINYLTTVKPEYLKYQFWDSIQGLCSYLRGVLTAKSFLQGAGVGNAEISLISVTFAWILKDGIGMISSLMLAYYFSNKFEIYCKEWRLFADILNNVALALEMLTNIFPSQFMLVTSISMICKSCCGLIASSTKARISNHFALNGQLADITAKESTQETAVALLGLLLGLIFTQLFQNDEFTTWLFFIVLSIIHQWANYKLIKVLIFDTFNPQRCYIVVKNYKEILTPYQTSLKETLYNPFYLSVFGPKLGSSIEPILESLNIIHVSLSVLQDIWKDQSYLIGYDKFGKVRICLNDTCNETDKIKSYFIGCYITQYWSDVSYFEMSIIQLKSKYDFLISSGGKIATNWYYEYMHNNLSAKGWNMSNNSSRLDEDEWRIKSKTK